MSWRCQDRHETVRLDHWVSHFAGPDAVVAPTRTDCRQDDVRSDDGIRAIFVDTFRVQKDVGVLGRNQRRLAWIAFLALALYAPVVAYALNVPLVAYTMPPDTWMLSVTVAGLVAFVIIVDDVKRRRSAQLPSAE
jgi:hypothetical protein